MTVTFRGRAAVGLAVPLCAFAFLLSGVLDSLAPTIRGLLLAAAGVTLLGVVLPLQLRTRTLLEHGVKVQGTVVGAEEKTGRGSDNLRYRTYHPVVRFTTTDGRTVTFTSGLGFSGGQPRIGSAVPVRYRQDDLEEAEIDRAYIWMLTAAPSLLAGLGLLVAAVVAFTADPQVAPAAVDNLEDPGMVAAAPEWPPDELPPATVERGRIGDTLTISDRSGKAQLKITVTRLKFSTGDGVDHPAHRFYMGLYVEAHALADEQYVLIEALIDGRTYDGFPILSSAEFEPSFNGFSLNRGDRAAGWLVVDVPARHGQIVLRNQYTHKIGVWTY